MKPKSKQSSVGKYVALIVATALLIVVGIFTFNSLQPTNTPESTTSGDITTQTPAEETDASESHISYKATKDGSALDQLQAVNETVVIVESDLGKYVDSVNDLAGGTDDKYWSFYVDGELAQVGADQYELKGGELIEWKFQKL